MLIKVCGMKYPENILQVADLQPDMMGFIFNPQSSRFAVDLDADALRRIPKGVIKAGVFVNETLENILTAVRKYCLDAVQIHGADNAALCRTLKEEAKVLVIKAFSVMHADNFKVTGDYENVCDYFLFDAKADNYTDAHQKFNWNILAAYKGEKAFLLSGNISFDDLKPIFKIDLPKLAGLDVGHKFETKPGTIDVPKLRALMEEVKNRNSSEIS